MNKILVIAPHPDDETLGCGGILLRHKAEGDEVHWLIVTGPNEDYGWSAEQVRNRAEEINQVSASYGFIKTHNLALPAVRLDTLPMTELIEKVGSIIKTLQPEVLYVPCPCDVHTDHKIIAQVVNACTKWFRCQSVRRVLAYETLSETDFNRIGEVFRPNVFIDISRYLDRKIEIMKIYTSEVGDFPFPRSEKTIRALAFLRGSQSGYHAAEAFQLLFERI